MKTLLTAAVLLPVLYIIIGTFILLIVFIWILKKMKVLNPPYGALDWSRLICISSFLFGIVFCSSSLIPGVFHNNEMLKSQQLPFSTVFLQSLQYFSQSFLAIFISDLIYLLIVYIVMNALPGEKAAKSEINNGNLPVAVLVSAIIIGFAIVFKLVDDQVMDILTPYVVNFH